MKKRIATRAVGVVAGTAIALLAAAPAAQAHYMRYTWDWGCGPLGVNTCGYSSVKSNHRTVYACDKYADGYGFYTKWVRSDGVSGTVRDKNGAKSGCGYKTAPSGKYIHKFKACRDMGSYDICIEKWTVVS